jgi:hypothetical protein
MTYDNDLVKKALVSLVIETTLLEIGKETYDKVVRDLHKKYHCYLPDCYITLNTLMKYSRICIVMLTILL